MMIEFKFKNFLSYKNETKLSFVASNRKELEENVINAERGIKLLKCVSVFGANAGGKSNIFKALKKMKILVMLSHMNNLLIEKDSFRFDEISKQEPTLLEIVFIVEKDIYRYGFMYSVNEVKEEWLYLIRKESRRDRELELFRRKEQNIKFNKRELPEAIGLENKVNEYTLFLTVLNQFNGKISKKIINWYKNLNIIDGLDNSLNNYTANKLSDNKFKDKLIEMLKIADFNINDIIKTEKKMGYNDLPEPIKLKIKKNVEDEFIAVSLKTMHSYRTKANENDIVEFDFDRDESEGTKRMFNLSGPIIDTMLNGKILFIDEFDARLHPLLSLFLLARFNGREYNKNKAQFAITSNNMLNMNNNYLRRDQILFADKNVHGISELYSLSDIKNVRKGEQFDKVYISGEYGAIPFISIDERK